MSDSPSPREPVLRIRDLALGYNRNIVVKDVNLELGAGQFVPFIGPNGAGKTTLLRAILGLIRPIAGSIECSFAVKPPGYVAQQKAIDPMYPVSLREIVFMGCMPLLRAGTSPADAWHFVDRELERFGLLDHRHKTFSELSGGMRQKAMIARAFVGQPDVLIMDEPATELDETAQRIVLESLHQAAVIEGRTVLLAHHGLDAMTGRTESVCLVRDGSASLVPLEEAHF